MRRSVMSHSLTEEEEFCIAEKEVEDAKKAGILTDTDEVDVGNVIESSESSEEFEDAIDSATESIEIETDPSVAETLLSACEYFRTKLPSDDMRGKFGFWSFLKTAMGKDLTKVAMPIQFNEPLSFLQRLAEDLHASSLLDMAAAETDQYKRIAYIGAFSVTIFMTTVDARVGKPFNPLLAETFEYIDKDKGFRLLSEQVSHHPPVSAHHCDSENWEFWQEYHAETKFRGNMIKFSPAGSVHVRLKTTGEHFSWNKPMTNVHNLILGKLWVDHEGDVTITNHGTKDCCLIRYQTYSEVGDKYRQIMGAVKDTKGRNRLLLKGNWENYVSCESKVGKVTLWNKPPLPINNARQFGFSSFALGLNEPCDNVAPTDCRHRPDIRLMEEGHIEEGSLEKFRLEEKQRAWRKERAANDTAHHPRWFKPIRDVDTNTVYHIYSGGYWAAKKQNKFAETRDIY